MVFKSDRQRKGFFASRGNVRSNIRPQITRLKPSQRILKGKFNIVSVGTKEIIVKNRREGQRLAREINKRPRQKTFAFVAGTEVINPIVRTNPQGETIFVKVS